MDERHAVAGVAALAHAGLGDATAVYLHPGRVGAHLALEEGLLHLWNQLGRPDHHAADGDELVDVCKAGREGSSSWLGVGLPKLEASWGGSGSAVQPGRTSLEEWRCWDGGGHRETLRPEHEHLAGYPQLWPGMSLL